MRTRLTLAAGTAALALVGSVFAATPAMADLTGSTTATFEITAGAAAVAISVPAPKALGTRLSGEAGLITSTLGAVTVTDDRAKLAAAWTVTAGTLGFSREGGTGTDAEKVAPAAVAYTPGAVTYGGGGTGTYVTAPLATMATAEALVGTYTGIAGSRTVSWDPTLVLSIAANQVAGTYSGTITHSVTVTV